MSSAMFSLPYLPTSLCLDFILVLLKNRFVVCSLLLFGLTIDRRENTRTLVNVAQNITLGFSFTSWGWQFDTTWYWKHPPVTPDRLKQILRFHLQTTVSHTADDTCCFIKLFSHSLLLLSDSLFPLLVLSAPYASSALIAGLSERLAPGPHSRAGLHHLHLLLLLLTKLLELLTGMALSETYTISILCCQTHLHTCTHAQGHKHLSLTHTYKHTLVQCSTHSELFGASVSGWS